jgi:hypothetical protein
MPTINNTLPIKMTSLVPDQSAFSDVFKFGPMPVDVTLTVTTKGLVTAKKYSTEEMKKHFAPIAEKVIANTETVVDEELTKLAAKLRELKKKPADAEAADKLVAETTLSVNNALAALQGAINAAVEARVKTEAQRDANLKEARAATAGKVGKITISLAAGIAKLVGTAGADVSSYISIAKDLKSAYDELRQQLKDEKQLAADVAAKLIAVKGASDASKRKELLTDAETARKKYRNHLSKYLEQMEAMGDSADQLARKMKEAKTLAKGVEIGAQAMTVKRQCTALQAKYQASEKKLDEMGELITQLGGKIDDRTTLEKLLALDKETIIEGVKAAAEAASLAKTGEDLVKTVAALA